MARSRHWGMVIDLDRCTGCNACVVACHAENNIKLSSESIYHESRATHWIRIERYWEGVFPDVKVRYLPVLCQQCANAPCETVCPVYATQHNSEGLNVQTYNRCIGTRYCANNCPYHARFFNYWPANWPDPLNYQLNPDVTVRTQGIMEKCTFCLQRINRGERRAREEQRDLRDGEIIPACVQACPTVALVFGDLRDPASRVSKLAADTRRYHLLEEQGTEPSVVYLKKAEPASHD